MMQTAAVPTEPQSASHTAEPEGTSSVDAWLTPGRFAMFLGVLVFATFPGVILGRETFVFRDFGLFSYPVAHFHRECFWRGELPLWNPYNHCGIPFLAQWNTMTLYPGSLLYLLFPLTWSLPFFCLAHLYWGGLGMYFLAHRWTGNRLAAALAGVIFSFNGLTLNFLMWPSHVATFAWLPWVLWLVPEGWRHGGRKLVWGVVAGSMQMLAGGPETILFTWVILLLLACGEWWGGRLGRKGSAASEMQPYQSRATVLRLLGMTVLVALVCAAQLLPFLQLLSMSQRDSSYSSSSHGWEMPFWGWVNFLIPLFRTSPISQGVYLQNGQYWTSSYYAGIGTLLLAAVAVKRVRNWQLRALAIGCFVGAVLAWGEGSLLFSGLKYCFPGLGFVRYPVKFVIIVVALAPLLAACGVAALRQARSRFSAFEWGCLAVLLAAMGLVVCLGWQSTPDDLKRPLSHNAISRAVILGVEFSLVGALLCWRNRYQTLLGSLLLGAFWVDFATHVPTQNPTTGPEVYSESHIVTPVEKGAALRSRVLLSAPGRTMLDHKWLPDVGENFLRHRAFSRPNVNLLDSTSQVDGFFSLVSRESYEVTGLPYKRPDMNLDHLLDFMGVTEVKSPGAPGEKVTRQTAMPLLTIGQQPVFADDAFIRKAIQTNGELNHVVFLPASAKETVSAASEPEAKVLSWKLNERNVVAEAESPAPAMLVAAQSYYPGWRVFIDGKEGKIWRANHCFQAMEIPAGRHLIRLTYKEPTSSWGIGLSCCGCVLLLLLLACRSAPGTGDTPGAVK